MVRYVVLFNIIKTNKSLSRVILREIISGHATPCFDENNEKKNEQPTCIHLSLICVLACFVLPAHS